MKPSFLNETMYNFGRKYGISEDQLREFCIVIRDAVIEIALYDIEAMGWERYRAASGLFKEEK